jgi:lipopolysaccharide export LptBFGC system permease protein LptF
MTLKELSEEIDKHERLLVDTTQLRTEYYRKITWSFASMIFILLGFPAAVITHRREKSANIVIAVAFAALYYLLSLGCEALSLQNIAPAAWLMWTPNILAGIGAFILNQKCVS